MATATEMRTLIPIQVDSLDDLWSKAEDCLGLIKINEIGTIHYESIDTTIDIEFAYYIKSEINKLSHVIDKNYTLGRERAGKEYLETIKEGPLETTFNVSYCCGIFRRETAGCYKIEVNSNNRGNQIKESIKNLITIRFGELTRGCC